MKYNYILGLDEADMKKIRGFRLRLVNFFFPSLIEFLKETANSKATYQKKWLDETDYTNELKAERNKLILEISALEWKRDERLRKAKTNHSMDINGYQVSLQGEQEKNEQLKKEIKALNETISKLKGQNSNKPKNNELERSSEVSDNQR